MKYRTIAGVLGICMLAALVGCGTKSEPKSAGQDVRSKAAGADSATAKGIEDEQESNLMKEIHGTDSCYYVVKIEDDAALDESEKTIGKILQFSTGDEKLGEVSIKGLQKIFYADEKGVYFIKQSGKKSMAICMVPAVKREDGKYSITGQQEKALITENHGNGIWGEHQGECGYYDSASIYADSRYFIYFTDVGEYVRYDREKGETVRETPFGRLNTKEFCPFWIAAACDDCIIAAGNQRGVYRQKIGTWEWQLISDKKECDYDFFVTSGSLCFYRQNTFDKGAGESIWVYNADTDKNEKIYDGKELEKAGKNDKEKDFIEMNGLFYSGNRLYIQATIGKINKNTKRKMAVFSKAVGDSALTYEKKLCESMWSQESEYISKQKEGGSYTENAARCIAIRDGKAILAWNKKDGKAGIGTYDLSAGKFAVLDSVTDMNRLCQKGVDLYSIRTKTERLYVKEIDPWSGFWDAVDELSK